MQIQGVTKKNSEKGQSTIGLLIFFPMLMLMVMVILYTGYPIYLKLAAQNASYSFAMETARAPGYNTNAMDDVGNYVVNRTPGMTTFARQTFLQPGPSFGGASDDPNDEFILRTPMNGQVTIVPNGDNNPVFQMLSIDPWLINPYFDTCNQINFHERIGEECLAAKVDSVLQKMRLKYAEYGVKHDPFVIVKADAGTYGMGIMTVKDASEITGLNRKQRNKMAVVKEGMEVSDVLVQEGVYTFENINEAVAEPVVYMIDHSLNSLFLLIYREELLSLSPFVINGLV